MPLVSVICVGDGTGGAEELVAGLRAQTLADWEAFVCGGHGAGALDGRVHSVKGGVNDALTRASGEFVMLLPAGTTLAPTALEALVVEARSTDAGAVYGRFAMTAPLGEIPGDASKRVGPRLDEATWSKIKAAPLGVQLFRREEIEGAEFDETEGGDWEWCLQLARRGMTWRRAESRVATIELRCVGNADAVLASIRAHRAVGAVCAVGAAGGVEAGEEIGGAAGAAWEAAEQGMLALKEHLGTPGARMRAGMDEPWQYALWWYRHGFVGHGPAHLLKGGGRRAPATLVELNERRPVDIFVASYKRPDRLAAMIESVRGTGYPARVMVGAGDLETVQLCERYPGLVECLYSTQANKLTGCTAPLNHVVNTLVRNDAIFCTDDCVFDKDSIDIAMRSLYTAFPDGDGVVGLAQENIPHGYPLAFPLMGRKFRERFTARGPLFLPGYFHMYNDAELGLTIHLLGNWHFEARAKLRHFHPCTGVAEDATHTRGRTLAGRDVDLWHERRVKGMVWGVEEKG